MTTYTDTPKGVCSRRMTVALEDGVIRDVRIEGGCNGNLQGISHLVIGMKAQDAIDRMRGIRCGGKPSSCRGPDSGAGAGRSAGRVKTYKKDDRTGGHLFYTSLGNFIRFQETASTASAGAVDS